MNTSPKPLGFIHRYIPAGDPNVRTTLLLLHGTGGDESDLLGLGGSLAPGAGLLSPRGKVLENGMPRFFRRLAEGVFDVEDLKVRTQELADFVQAAAAAYRFSSEQVVAVGFSNGANIAASMLLLRPEVLAAAALFRPMVPLVPDQMPHLSGKAVFLAAGSADPIVSAKETKRLRSLLEKAGAEVTLREDPSGHTITAKDVQKAKAWVKKWISREEALQSGRDMKGVRK